jgi:hypothetical protein
MARLEAARRFDEPLLIEPFPRHRTIGAHRGRVHHWVGDRLSAERIAPLVEAIDRVGQPGTIHDLANHGNHYLLNAHVLPRYLVVCSLDHTL